MGEISHSSLVQAAARWLENTRKCSLVLTEFTSAGFETPDAIGWRIAEGWSILVECKTSRSDFRRDREKISRQHRSMSIGQERWYLTPPGLLRAEEVPDGWGLLEAGNRVRRAVRCPAAPDYEVGSHFGRSALNREVQANELGLLLSVYRRKFCAACSRAMNRGVLADDRAPNVLESPLDCPNGSGSPQG